MDRDELRAALDRARWGRMAVHPTIINDHAVRWAPLRDHSNFVKATVGELERVPGVKVLDRFGPAPGAAAHDRVRMQLDDTVFVAIGDDSGSFLFTSE